MQLLVLNSVKTEIRRENDKFPKKINGVEAKKKLLERNQIISSGDKVEDFNQNLQAHTTDVKSTTVVIQSFQFPRLFRAKLIRRLNLKIVQSL